MKKLLLILIILSLNQKKMFNFLIFKFDVPFDNQIFFQDTASPTMSGIVDLHQHVFFFLIIIFVLVFFQIVDLVIFFRLDAYFAKLDKVFWIKANKFNIPELYKDLIINYENSSNKRYAEDTVILAKIDKDVFIKDVSTLTADDLEEIDWFLISNVLEENENTQSSNTMYFFLISLFLPFYKSFIKLCELLSIDYEKLFNINLLKSNKEIEPSKILSSLAWDRIIKSVFVHYNKFNVKLDEHPNYTNILNSFNEENDIKKINEGFSLNLLSFDSVFIGIKNMFSKSNVNFFRKLYLKNSSILKLNNEVNFKFLQFVLKYILVKTNLTNSFKLNFLDNFVKFIYFYRPENIVNMTKHQIFQKISRFVEITFPLTNNRQFLSNNFDKLNYHNNESVFKFVEMSLRRNLISSFVKTKIEKFTHNTYLETIWTLIPIIIVLSIAIPSFILMYALDAALDGSVTIKVIGHQWYWNYECEFPFEYVEETFIQDFINFINDIGEKKNKNETFVNVMFKAAYPLMKEIYVSTPDSVKFDSYMVYDANLKKGALRLLEVDKPLFVPYRLPIDVVITAADVLHAWAIPSLGVKVDAVPGRLNHIGVFIERKGVFFGQCSELCGVNHAFMPIKLVAVSFSDYINHCQKYQLG